MDEVRRLLLRIWVPDRPGALGAVTTRLGAVRADVIGLEVVERGGGQAIDELVIDVPADVPMGLLLREISAEDGVMVEDIREIEAHPFDSHVDALDAAATLLRTASLAELTDLLCVQVGRYVRATWAIVVDADDRVLSSGGPAPDAAWIAAFTTGSPTLHENSVSAELDTLWVPLEAAEARLVVGRETAFRVRERERIAGLAAIADIQFQHLRGKKRLKAVLAHPAHG